MKSTGLRSCCGCSALVVPSVFLHQETVLGRRDSTSPGHGCPGHVLSGVCVIMEAACTSSGHLFLPSLLCLDGGHAGVCVYLTSSGRTKCNSRRHFSRSCDKCLILYYFLTHFWPWHECGMVTAGSKGLRLLLEFVGAQPQGTCELIQALGLN